MTDLQCTKVENCFKDAQTYRYRLPRAIDESWMEAFALWGQFDCNRKFRRPFFVLTMENGVVVKGMMGDDSIKVSFMDESVESDKVAFEKMLAGLCLRMGEERGR